MLNTVNEYLSVVANTVKEMDGTLDKFIGDCVMAFWGAPAAKPNHASACVRAAIQAQRAIHELNERRATQNQKIEEENTARFAAGLEPTPLLPLLMLGSGINTGMATAGLMGLDAKERQFNYTVFGSEVNLASRLEGLSGRGRIFISESTYERLKQEDPELAAICVQDPTPRYVKGIATPITVYEVPWRPSAQKQAEPDSPPLKNPAEPAAAAQPRTTGS
jgi:adenylate cyclase